RTGRSVSGFLEWVRELVDAPELRIEGARQSATVAQKLLQRMQERIAARVVELQKAAARSGQQIRAAESEPPEGSGLRRWTLRKLNADYRLREIVQPYAEARLNELLTRTVAKIARII